MESTHVQISIPFKSILDSVKKLNQKEKLRLWQVLEEQVGQYDEEQLEKDPTIRKEIAEARQAYLTGDYVTLDEYMARCKERKK